MTASDVAAPAAGSRWRRSDAWRTVFTPVATSPSRVTGRAAALGLVAVVAGTTLSLVRQTGAGALDTVWAEDGQVFLTDAVNRSPVDAITTTYAGYYHLVPRLLAQIATLAPASAAAAVLAVEAALVTSLLALLVYVASGAHLTTRLSRLLAAGVVVALPLGQGDLPNSIANLHWPGLYALFWMLLWNPRGRAGRILAVAVVFLVAASDILVVALLPLAALRILARRNPTPPDQRDVHGLVLGGALCAGLAIQAVGVFTGSGERALSPDPVRPVTGYLLRAVPSAMLGQRWFGTTIDARWIALAGLAWLLVAAFVAVALTRRSAPAWPLAVAAAATSFALYALPVALTGVATPRYAAAPVMLVVTALAALVQPPAPAQRVPLYALAGLLVLVWAANLVVDNQRAHGPRWGTELDRAKAACTTGGVTEVEVLTPPVEEPAWSARLPCRYVQR